MEAKLCPDGSSVGRVGPNCAFAPCPAVPEPSVSSDVISRDACETDDDCICDGFDEQADKCFVGTREYHALYVNTTRQCPDFCTGIAGNFETKCVEKTCALVTRKPVARVDLVASHGFIVAPAFVELSAHLAGPAPKDFDCTRVRWDFGDTLRQEQAAPCFLPTGEPMDKSFKISHKYLRPGNYTATFSVGGVSGSALVVAYPTIAPPECDKDGDCVPAQCCHAGDCIVKEKRADCSKVACTMECRPGTLDCGGGCACISNRCSGRNFYPGEDAFTGPRPWQAFP